MLPVVVAEAVVAVVAFLEAALQLARRAGESGVEVLALRLASQIEPFGPDPNVHLVLQPPLCESDMAVADRGKLPAEALEDELGVLPKDIGDNEVTTLYLNIHRYPFSKQKTLARGCSGEGLANR